MPHSAKVEHDAKKRVVSFEVVEFLNEESAAAFKSGKVTAEVHVDGPKVTIRGIAIGK